MKALLFNLLATCFITTSCHRNDLLDDMEPADSPQKAIVGKWDWKETIYYERGAGASVHYTPASEAIVRQYVFGNDGNLHIIENGDEVARHIYHITTSAKLTGSSAGYDEFLLKIGPDLLYILSIKDTLILSNRLNRTDYYIRK